MQGERRGGRKEKNNGGYLKLTTESGQFFDI
jgi:hypothetical protein